MKWFPFAIRVIAVLAQAQAIDLVPPFLPSFQN